MMPDLTSAALFAGTLITALGAVYLGSKDAGRRRRAWRLLKLLLGR
jgi:hypothetical protein